ncbi:hypothetical protein CLF_107925 [Clonorchis sinensis]|uniref:Uncharacterized protein n=1 Tax=Clonorchis sinensis TaxID=79923 RepID=G7YHC6_CLOSI|nr:hypothetical protein CLF_107925 [Clonorchis sinensis]
MLKSITVSRRSRMRIRSGLMRVRNSCSKRFENGVSQRETFCELPCNPIITSISNIMCDPAGLHNIHQTLWLTTVSTTEDPFVTDNCHAIGRPDYTRKHAFWKQELPNREGRSDRIPQTATTNATVRLIALRGHYFFLAVHARTLDSDQKSEIPTKLTNCWVINHIAWYSALALSNSNSAASNFYLRRACFLHTRRSRPRRQKHSLRCQGTGSLVAASTIQEPYPSPPGSPRDAPSATAIQMMLNHDWLLDPHFPPIRVDLMLNWQAAYFVMIACGFGVWCDDNRKRLTRDVHLRGCPRAQVRRRDDRDYHTQSDVLPVVHHIPNTYRMGVLRAPTRLPQLHYPGKENVNAHKFPRRIVLVFYASVKVKFVHNEGPPWTLIAYLNFGYSSKPLSFPKIPDDATLATPATYDQESVQLSSEYHASVILKGLAKSVGCLCSTNIQDIWKTSEQHYLLRSGEANETAVSFSDCRTSIRPYWCCFMCRNKTNLSFTNSTKPADASGCGF